MAKQIPDALKEALKDLIDTHCGIGSVDQNAQKLDQYHEIRRNELYYQGEQYLVRKVTGNGTEYVPLRIASDGTPTSGTGTSSDEYVVNIYKGDVRKFVAVLGQKAPTVNAEAASALNDDHISRANTADNIIRHLYHAWDVPKKQLEIAYNLAVKSTAFVYTPWVVSKERYGTTTIPKFEDVEPTVIPAVNICYDCSAEYEGEVECTKCGSMNTEELSPSETVDNEPEQIGEETFENGSVECHVLSGLEVSTPFDVKCVAETPWLMYEREHNKASVLAAFPEHAEVINAAGTMDRYAGTSYRAASGSYSKVYLSHDRTNMVSVRLVWIRPSQYNWLPKELKAGTKDIEQGGDELAIAALHRMYPSGAKITIIGDTVIRCEDENLDDVWAEIPPESSSTMWPKPYMDDMIDCQNRVNDLYEIVQESMERSLPITIADPKILRPDKVKKLQGTYGNIVWSEPSALGDYSKHFYQFRTTEVRPEMLEIGNVVHHAYREVTGILPEIFGGGTKHQTFGEAQMDKNQALMALGVPWYFMRRGWEKAFYNGVRQVAKNSVGGKFYIEQSKDYYGEGIELPSNINELLLGGWKVSSDESMPLTTDQVRVWMESLLQSAPEVAMRLGMFHPENLPRMNDIMGIAGGWVIPEDRDRRAVMDAINKLKLESAITQEDEMGNIMEQSSEPFDPFLYDPVFAAQVIKTWLTSEEGNQLREENPAAWQNVYLYGQQAYSMSLPPAPEPDGSMPPEEPGMV